MHAELLAVDSPAWRSVLSEVRHDAYHLPEYVSLTAVAEVGAPCALYVEGAGLRVLVPLIRREIRGVDAIDFTSPYGYPGPLVAGDTSTSLLHDALESGLAHLRDRGGVSVFVRQHPLMPVAEDAWASLGAVVAHGPTVSIDLTLPFDDAFAQMRGSHRHEIRKAIHDGYVAVHDEGWARYGEFVELYRGTMHRLEAKDFYFFPDEYFLRLRTDLGTRAHLWHVERDGHVAASAIVLVCCGIVEYHLSASDPRFSKDQPTKLLLSAVHRWACGLPERRVFHLGGGRGSGEDSLFFFKAGFSKSRHVFSTVRAILDRERYASLTQARGGEAGEVTSFFPAYRR